MIENLPQYEVSKERLKQFEETFAAFQEKKENYLPERYDVYKETFEILIESLNAEIREYENNHS